MGFSSLRLSSETERLVLRFHDEGAAVKTIRTVSLGATMCP